VLLQKPAKEWLVFGVKEKFVKEDVIACGTDSYKVIADKKREKYKLYMHDSGKIFNHELKWDKKKSKFMWKKQEFEAVEFWIYHLCAKEPTKGRYNRLIRPVQPANPSKMKKRAPTQRVAM
jgi:hypothetical protein